MFISQTFTLVNNESLEKIRQNKDPLFVFRNDNQDYLYSTSTRLISPDNIESYKRNPYNKYDEEHLTGTITPGEVFSPDSGK